MNVEVVDPSAFTPAYDRALCEALGRAEAEVELITSRFLYGPVPPASGYVVSPDFYTRSAQRGLDAPFRRTYKAYEHFLDMLAFRKRWSIADVTHYEWLTVPQLDVMLLPDDRPTVYTVHYLMPPKPSRRQRWAARRILTTFNSIIALSRHSAVRMRDELGMDPRRIHIIPHGAFDYLTKLSERPLEDELARVEGPVVLAFGLIRDYKGTDVLLEAFREIDGAELWIVGMPRVPMKPLRELAKRCRGTVRFVEQYVEDAEIPAFFRRADVVVLPYTDAEQSGVLHTGLAFGKPMILSDVGGFPEVAARGGGLLVPPGDAGALAKALRELLASEEQRRELAEAAAEAAAGPYSWERVAERHMEVYEDLWVRRILAPRPPGAEQQSKRFW
jgi:glycosyltransferase involved in cell wall biosynthesis